MSCASKHTTIFIMDNVLIVPCRATPLHGRAVKDGTLTYSTVINFISIAFKYSQHTAVDFEFSENGRQMKLDCLFGNAKNICNYTIAFTQRTPLQHLYLTWGKCNALDFTNVFCVHKSDSTLRLNNSGNISAAWVVSNNSNSEGIPAFRAMRLTSYCK